MRLCIDCKHFQQTGSDSPTCAAAPQPDYVFGRQRFYHCATLRAGHVPTDCGPAGQHFKPRLEAA